MPQPSWEIEGGGSAVLFPVSRIHGDRWRCRILNYPRLFLVLTEEELNSTWQAAPRIDPKWFNPGSYWVHRDVFFVKGSYDLRKDRPWSVLVRFSVRIDEINGPLVHYISNDPDKILMGSMEIRSFAQSYVRLWETPFPAEPLAFVYTSKPKRYRPKTALPETTRSALDMILLDDD